MTILSGQILPIVVIDDAENADPLADALLEAGIHQVEVTLRTSAALEATRRMSKHDGLSVGVGTALTAAQVDQAADAGAGFVISPGLVGAVVERTMQHGLLSIPGVATPTEVARGLAFGLRTFKLFPAEQLGGTALLSALAPVFPDVEFVPSGGIGPGNARDYLKHPAVAAISGSWMTPRDLIAARDFASIADLCRSALELTS